MKRFIVLLLALSMIFTLAACGKKTECDICGKNKNCKTVEVMGEELDICSKCEDQLDDLNDLAENLLG